MYFNKYQKVGKKSSYIFLVVSCITVPTLLNNLLQNFNCTYISLVWGSTWMSVQYVSIHVVLSQTITAKSSFCCRHPRMLVRVLQMNLKPRLFRSTQAHRCNNNNNNNTHTHTHSHTQIRTYTHTPLL